MQTHKQEEVGGPQFALVKFQNESIVVFDVDSLNVRFLIVKSYLIFVL